MSETNNKKNTRKTGDLGEKIAQKYLKEHGFTILETNYLKKWGELDIVAKKEEVIHFIEVKTLQYKSKMLLKKAQKGMWWRPEDQVHARKLHQIEKALETWLSENKWKGEYQVDVIAIKMVKDLKFATVTYIDHVIKEYC